MVASFRFVTEHCVVSVSGPGTKEVSLLWYYGLIVLFVLVVVFNKE
jgi:hypothetical protein